MRKVINYLYDECISEEALAFIESSKMHQYDVIEYSKRLVEIMNTDYFMEHIANHSHELGFADEYLLEDIPFDKDENKALNLLNHNRSSLREFNQKQGLSFAELSQLLKLSYTKTQAGIKDKFIPSARNIASGGGLYPVDMYFVNQRIEQLPKGVYHYNLDRMSLEKTSDFESDIAFQEAVKKAFFTEAKNDMDYRNATGYIILGSVLNRTCFKYLDRGIRWALIDTGAIIHSIYLASTALELACCAVGGYCDDLVAELIGFTDKSQVVLIGKI
jgi:SagB-type dehydrogenase family enzyme